MDVPPIETLRTAFAQSAIATLATQVATYMRLAAHPDAHFSDLLDALDRGPVIGDDAARRLHQCLGIPGAAAPIIRRAYWENILHERGIEAVQPFRAASVASSQPAPMPVIQQK